MITSIPKEEFFEILNFILYDCNQFTYDGKIYKQLKGTPMGLPLSPIVLDTAIAKLGVTPKVFIKYVDDLLSIIPFCMILYEI